MNISLSKKTLLYIAAVVWIIFSVGYILCDAWSDFKNGEMAQAYQQGKTDTINALMVEAEKCQPFSVYSAEKQIQLMDLGCQQGSAK